MTRGARLRLIVGYLLSAVDHGRYPCKTPRDGVYGSDAGLRGERRKAAGGANGWATRPGASNIDLQ